MGAGIPTIRFKATAWIHSQTITSAVKSKSNTFVSAPSATTRLLAQAGGCGQDNRTNKKQVRTSPSDALVISGQPLTFSDTAWPLKKLIRHQAPYPLKSATP